MAGGYRRAGSALAQAAAPTSEKAGSATTEKTGAQSPLVGLALKIIVCLGLGFGSIEPPGPVYEGYAARYGAKVFDAVAHNRGLALKPCMLAFTHATEITGEDMLWVEGTRTGVRRHCHIYDLPQPYDRANLIRRKIIVELDRESARAVCGSVVDPPRQCPVKVWR